MKMNNTYGEKMQNEELDEQISQKINEIIDKVMINIVELCDINSKYTDFNLVMNVLTGCMVKMMMITSSELRPIFIETIKRNLEINRLNFEKKEI